MLSSSPSFTVNTSFKPDTLAVFIFNSQVLFSLSRDFEAQSFDFFYDIAVIGYGSFFNTLQEESCKLFAGMGTFIRRDNLSTTLEACRMNIRMFWSTNPETLWIIRLCPAFPPVVHITQRVKVFLPPGREWVEGLTRGKFHPGNDKVQFMVSCVTVTHPKNGVLVWGKAREGGLLKVVHEPLFLFWRHMVFWPPRQHPRTEFPLAVL